MRLTIDSTSQRKQIDKVKNSMLIPTILWVVWLAILSTTLLANYIQYHEGSGLLSPGDCPEFIGWGEHPCSFGDFYFEKNTGTIIFLTFFFLFSGAVTIIQYCWLRYRGIDV